MLALEGTPTRSKKVRMLTLGSQIKGKDVTMEGTTFLDKQQKVKDEHLHWRVRLKETMLALEGTPTRSKKVRMLTLGSRTKGKDVTMEGTKINSKRLRMSTYIGE